MKRIALVAALPLVLALGACNGQQEEIGEALDEVTEGQGEVMDSASGMVEDKADVAEFDLHAGEPAFQARLDPVAQPLRRGHHLPDDQKTGERGDKRNARGGRQRPQPDIARPAAPRFRCL